MGACQTGPYANVLVLSGGGVLGAMQAGVVAELTRSGWVPDVIVGTSAGALNGAWMAAGFTPGRADELCEVWSSLGRRGMFPAGPLTQLVALVARRPGTQRPTRLLNMIDRLCPVADLADLPIPLHVSATDLVAAETVWFTAGPPSTVLCASASVPGLFPPVVIAGRQLVDGSVLANVPVDRALSLQPRCVVCVDVSYGAPDMSTPNHALEVLVRAHGVALRHMAAVALERVSERVPEFHYVHPLPPVELNTADWGRTAELVAEGRRQAVTLVEDVVGRQRRAGVPAGRR